MRIIMAAELYDSYDPLILEIQADSELSSGKKRITRTATLDGESEFSDSGFSHSDSNMIINLQNHTFADIQGVERLMQDYDFVLVSSFAGFFKCKISSYRSHGSKAVVNLFIHSKQDS